MTGRLHRLIHCRGVAPPLLAWALSVVVFAATYHILWNASPDAFILNKEFNLRPLSTLRTLYFDDEMPVDDALGISTTDDLAESTSKVAALLADVKQQRTNLRALTQQEAAAKKMLHDAGNKLDEEQGEQIQVFTQEQTKDAQALVGNTEAVVAKHRTAANDARQAGDLQRAARETKLVADAVRVAGEAKVALADKQVSVADYVLHHLGDFGTATAKEAVDHADTESRNVLKAQIEVENQRQKTRNSTAALVQALWADRQGRLGFVDFLYFSAGMSTSNSFGDITANSRMARSCVIAQILFSVMIVAWFLNCLFESKRPTS